MFTRPGKPCFTPLPVPPKSPGTNSAAPWGPAPTRRDIPPRRQPRWTLTRWSCGWGSWGPARSWASALRSTTSRYPKSRHPEMGKSGMGLEFQEKMGKNMKIEWHGKSWNIIYDIMYIQWEDSWVIDITIILGIDWEDYGECTPLRDLDVEEGGPLDAPTNKLDKSLGSWIYSYLYTGVETNLSWMNEDRKQIYTYITHVHTWHMLTCSLMSTYVTGPCLVQMLVNQNTNCGQVNMEPHEAKQMSICIRSNTSPNRWLSWRQRSHWISEMRHHYPKCNNDVSTPKRWCQRHFTQTYQAQIINPKITTTCFLCRFQSWDL